MYECLNHKAVVILVAFILVYFRYEIQYNKIFSYFNFTDELIFFFFFSVLQSLYPYREKAQAVRLNGVILLINSNLYTLDNPAFINL